MSGGDHIVSVEVLRVCCVTDCYCTQDGAHTALLWWCYLEVDLHATSKFVCMLTILIHHLLKF